MHTHTSHPYRALLESLFRGNSDVSALQSGAVLPLKQWKYTTRHSAALSNVYRKADHIIVSVCLSFDTLHVFSDDHSSNFMHVKKLQSGSINFSVPEGSLSSFFSQINNAIRCVGQTILKASTSICNVRLRNCCVCDKQQRKSYETTFILILHLSDWLDVGSEIFTVWVCFLFDNDFVWARRRCVAFTNFGSHSWGL